MSTVIPFPRPTGADTAETEAVLLNLSTSLADRALYPTDAELRAHMITIHTDIGALLARSVDCH